MIDAKEAVKIAAEYIRSVIGEVEGLGVEEIEIDGSVWLVTMGYWEYLPEQTYLFPHINEPRRKVRRSYKQFRIDSMDGSVYSMKIRTPPAPEPQ